MRSTISSGVIVSNVVRCCAALNILFKEYVYLSDRCLSAHWSYHHTTLLVRLERLSMSDFWFRSRNDAVMAMSDSIHILKGPKG
jgi:hypothetical protein